MTTDTLPWGKIKIPKNNLGLLRVSPRHPHDFFWGRDTGGRYLLILKCSEFEIREELKRRKMELSGVKIDIRLIPDTEETFFMVLLQRTENADIFLALCNDLIQKTEPIVETSTAIETIFSRLERWRVFLSRARKDILSERQVQGLFSELKFLKKCIEKYHVSPASAVEGWYGPIGGPHDFVFGQSAIEIKSITESQSDSVLISSENQLQTHLEHLYLHILMLSRDNDCMAGGTSLNCIVRKLREKFTGEALLDIFEERLLDAGYIDITDYDLPHFSVSETRTYEVSENFPRITPDTLPEGIKDVSYKINFSSISNYTCDVSAVVGRK